MSNGRGASWDLFESDGSADGELQIQRVDCPDEGVPEFADDGDAIIHVMACAARGDADAIGVLDECDDRLVDALSAICVL